MTVSGVNKILSTMNNDAVIQVFLEREGTTTGDNDYVDVAIDGTKAGTLRSTASGWFNLPSSTVNSLKENETVTIKLNARTEFDSKRFCTLIHELAAEDVPAKQEPAVPEGAYLFRESTKEKIYLPDEGLVMGKDPQQSDYCIAENQAVSRRHAQLEKMDGEWNLIDLNSLNGTYKNGERLVGNIANRLENKDVIFLADERFIYYA